MRKQFLILFLVPLLFLPFVSGVISGDVGTLGVLTYSGYATGASGYVVGNIFKFVSATYLTADLTGCQVVFDGRGYSGKGCVWLAEDSSLVAVSSNTISGGLDTYDLTFTGVTFANNTEYIVGVVVNGACRVYGGIGSPTGAVGQLDNNYASPVAFANNLGVNDPTALTITLSGVSPPTPSPSASASVEQPEFFENFAEWLVPMGLILGLGLLLWKFAGKWGFFSGMIIGLVVSYVFLDGASNLWAYVIVGVVLMTAMFASTRGNS